jgi:hypothetical protein
VKAAISIDLPGNIRRWKLNWHYEN